MGKDSSLMGIAPVRGGQFPGQEWGHSYGLSVLFGHFVTRECSKTSCPTPGQGEPNSSSAGLGEIVGSESGASPRVVSSLEVGDEQPEIRNRPNQS
jgi:hypothetical protein